MSLSSAQKNALNSISPRAIAAGINLGDIIDSILTDMSSGNLGITADAGDVDSVALGGGHGAQDADTTTGLTFGYKAFRFHNGLALVTVSAGTILLTASQTNYVEVDRAGTVSANVSAFTSGKLPLWTITTGTATITAVTYSAPVRQLIGTAGVVGSMLSTAGATKSIEIPLGDISATTAFNVVLPNVAGVVARISFATKTAISTSDTDYWTFGVVNKGAAGSGTTAVVDNTAAANSTKVTGGTAITGYVKRNLTLSGTPANLVTAAEDVLEVTITKASSATTMAQCVLRVDLTFTA